ncbi:mechanosensitive ion channel family protein [Kamptonema formosum]|nr:mechanosensitive ion channel family protein [Kamptonema formosum]
MSSSAVAFLSNFGILGLTIVSLYLLFLVLRVVLRRLPTDLPLVALNISRGPILLLVCFVGMNLLLAQWGSSLEFNGQPVTIGLIQRGLSALNFLIVTYWIAQLLTQVVLYALKQYADRSEAMWDDVLIPILQNILPFFTYFIGGLLALQQLGFDLSGLLVTIGGAAFILGFALKDILANFFSGLVLLIDTPFSFGDVVALPDGSRAVIRKIGLRLTSMYLIDSHSEIYIPNAAFQSQNIVNLSRPTSHYYYTISIPIKGDVEPARAISLMEKVVLAHPDTMGDIEQKLEAIERYYGYSGAGVKQKLKREVGVMRLLAEQEVTRMLLKIEINLKQLSDIISGAEQGGLDAEEIRAIQKQFLEICLSIGLERRAERQDKRKRSKLVEIGGAPSNNTLIGLVRIWYQCWLKDPDLFKEDLMTLPREWEQRINLLIIKINKLYQTINNPVGMETRLDDLVESFQVWMSESFKSSRNQWQDPKIWVNEVNGDQSRETTVRFYVDSIKLEHCERGNRIKSEVRQDLVWHLRQSYLM